ncbi:MAG TPA: hypothetical protein VN862_04460 [Candidatus Acidoferrales bacterium]|nr:hypothetical protein [Candidatus Acidoferrales bacterium]
MRSKLFCRAIRVLTLLSAVFFTLAILPGAARAQEGGSAITSQTFENLKWRNIGPAAVDGRQVALAGVPGDPSILYAGSASGGLWKTVDGGVTWQSVFDHENTLSIGAIAIEPNNPEVVWVGTGEGTARNTVSFGDGIYRSTDGGKSWQNMGLKDADRFTQIVINPRNPNIVFAAALGHMFGTNEERGVFMTTDGGKNWQKVLYLDPQHGAADLAIDQSNSNVLYATMWYFLRRPWTYTSGDEKGGVFKSVDGGLTWNKLTNGLPKLMGRTGVQVSASNPSVVYVVAESNEGTMFRSDDAGESFHMVSKMAGLLGRGPYYAQMRIDPVDENTLYAIAMSLFMSIDGGHTWKNIAQNVHSDHHAIWIDPKNHNRVWQANDGQIAVSYDRAKTWEALDAYAATQLYHIYADNEEPFYHVTGGLQDNGVFTAPSGTREGGIENSDWTIVAFGDGFYGVNNLSHPEIYLADTQGGNITRINTMTHEVLDIGPQPERNDGGPVDELKYRFNWNTPILPSSHDVNTVYFAGNVVFKSTDFGLTWQAVSPDLTTNDPGKTGNAGGPVWPENTTAEYYCTIIALNESPVRAGVLWAGTDDGNLQVTNDGGKSWSNVIGNVSGVPAHSEVSSVEPSHTGVSVAYATFDNHMMDDYHPYVFKTTDGGKSWRNITGDLPEHNWVWVVREDPKNANLLYAGTELGLYASFTGGNHWIKLSLGNLPNVAVRDLMIHPKMNDILLATHGRGAWILDDATPIQKMAADVLNSDAYLFDIRPAMRYTSGMQVRFFPGDKTYIAPNPPSGAIITYYLKDAPRGKNAVKIQILDARGTVIRELKDSPKAQGLNRANWDLKIEAPRPRREGEEAAGAGFFGGGGGPEVPPGTYQIKLIANGKETEKPVTVRFDPHTAPVQAALQEQFEMAVKLRDMASTANDALRALDTAQAQLEQQEQTVRNVMQPRAPQEVIDALEKAKTQVHTMIDEMAKSNDLPPYSVGPKISNKIGELMRGVDSVSTAPTPPQNELFTKLQGDLQRELAKVNAFTQQDLAKLNELMHQHGISSVLWVGKPIETPR